MPYCWLDVALPFLFVVFEFLFVILDQVSKHEPTLFYTRKILLLIRISKKESARKESECMDLNDFNSCCRQILAVVIKVALLIRVDHDEVLIAVLSIVHLSKNCTLDFEEAASDSTPHTDER